VTGSKASVSELALGDRLAVLVRQRGDDLIRDVRTLERR
jgi:hypothetical protein